MLRHSVLVRASAKRVACLLACLALGWAADATALAQPVPAISFEQGSVVDFRQFIGQRTQTNGPVQVGPGIVWSALRDGWVGDMPFGLRTNGYWDAGREGFAALNASDSAMLFNFADPVSHVGAFVNYAPYLGQGPLPTIEALDARGAVIDSLTLDIQTPNGVNEGRFLGFEHEVDDIFAFRYRARFGVLDDLAWRRERGIIPAPSALAALSWLGLAVAGRRRPRTRR